MESACVFGMKFPEKRGHLYGLTLLARWKRNRIQFSPEKRPISGLFSLKIRTQQNKNFVALEEENSADRSYKAANVLLINQLYYFDKGFAIGRAVSGFLLFCLILMFFLYSPPALRAGGGAGLRIRCGGVSGPSGQISDVKSDITVDKGPKLCYSVIAGLHANAPFTTKEARTHRARASFPET